MPEKPGIYNLLNELFETLEQARKEIESFVTWVWSGEKARKPRSFASPKFCRPSQSVIGVKCRATSKAKNQYICLSFFMLIPDVRELLGNFHEKNCTNTLEEERKMVKKST